MSVTSTVLVITARSNAIKDNGVEKVRAVRVTVYVSGRRFENEARRFDSGSTRAMLGPPLVVLPFKLTPSVARVAFP
jgi:hypothetical protein